nr:tectonin beta-propeller repeat-containing protein 2-like isoform X1 [Procambarus clarkii]XP_045595375.1 tectonin beta-propeller repeat-containing protein 2-like isoform X1 [Procambarus clarkii]XP_045595376.1 tectonin beta-propeller repeat-containing protein 2-like isoform X1 [Procambarus clarkii]
MTTEENPVWTEWMPLGSLLDQLPQQFQRGLGAADLLLTCLATLPQHLVLGTNVGLVYLAHLPSANLMRLKCENPLSPLSSVASLRTVDDMIAAGAVDGTLTIFQLPRVANFQDAQSSSTSDSRVLRPKGIIAVQPTVKRFTVANVHSTRITSLTWSRNGMRLFSGDANGVVSAVEINYQTSECTAKKLLLEKSSITQLSYHYQLLAVSTLERALIYNLTQGKIHQVGQKPRKYLGLFGCIWHPTISCSEALLYTSRPGLRLWSSTSEGEVMHTHIIKELPETAAARLLNPSIEKPREGEKFSFGLLHMLGTSHIVSYNPHWIFIVDVNSLKVLSYSGQFRHITGVAVSDREIYVLEGSRYVACLSTEPLEMGEKVTPPHTWISSLTEAENLRDIGSRLVSRGSGIIEQIARVSGSVAAKFSEHASSSAIIGHDAKNNQQQGFKKTNPMATSLHQPSQKLQQHDYLVPTADIDIKREKQGHHRSSSSGTIQESEQFPRSSASAHPRMVQSVSSFFPSLFSSPLLITSLGKTPPLQDIYVTGEMEVSGDFEEIVTSSQIVAQEGGDSEPLVQREKPKKKMKKKYDAIPSPDTLSINSFKSTSDTSDSASSGTPSSLPVVSPVVPPVGPPVEPPMVSSCVPKGHTHQDVPASRSTDSSQTIQPKDKNSGLITNERTIENLETVCDNLVEGPCKRVDFEESEENHIADKVDFSSVDTRTYDDFKSDIQQKESILAEILDLGCLKMDHEMKSSEENVTETRSSEDCLILHREHSFESTVSTPSTLKESSPAPSNLSTCDFYAQFYTCDNSYSSVDSGTDIYSHQEVAGCTNTVTDRFLLRDGDEQIASNISEDRHSCLSYGPPSGSSLLSLGNRPQAEALEQATGDSKDMHTVTDSSDVADISWSYATSDVQECFEYDEEEMTGGWIRHRFPGSVTSLSVSENNVAFVDDCNCIFFKDINAESKSWRKAKLTAKASQISSSPSGGIMWIQFVSNVYAICNPKLELLPTSKMVPVARNVLQMCVDEELTWYINQENQVCVQPSLSDKSPLIVRCEDFKMVQIACRYQVVWGLSDQGHVVFRIGVTTQSPLGHDWGVMEAHDMLVVTLALGPGERGWIVDDKGRVYFRLGVCAKYPQGSDSKWWQVVTSDYMMEFMEGEHGRVMLSASSKGIWLAQENSNWYSVHDPKCTGHVWSVFSEDVWSTICAEGLYTDQGAICCLSPLGQLFVVNPNTASCVPFDLPKNECVMCVSQRPEAMWVLTAAGDIFIRIGLSAKSLHGSHWKHLDLSQIGDIHLCHISCGMDVVWGVDTRGGVYMRQGRLTPSVNESLPPAWIQVDPVPLKGNAVFTKVFVGMKLHMVWAVDSCRRVYVREAIFPELPIGLSWVPVAGLLALHMSISENEVYALTPNGEVFKRVGVTNTNYIGDAWQKIPGNLAKISVTVDDCLWGLNNRGRICQHDVFKILDLPKDKTIRKNKTISLSSETLDWEVL